jgi:hypothetical protein
MQPESINVTYLNQKVYMRVQKANCVCPSAPLLIRIKQLDSHGENCRELTHLLFEPNMLTNFGFGKIRKK